jgi:hypothetical protein
MDDSLKNFGLKLKILALVMIVLFSNNKKFLNLFNAICIMIVFAPEFYYIY